MFSLLKHKHSPILGIDISSSAVSILNLSGSKSGDYCLHHYARVALPDSVFNGNLLTDMDAVATYIKELCNQMAFTTKKVALAVPDSSVLIKSIYLHDGLNALEMEELVAMEIEKLIPYPLNEINWDFEIQGTSPDNPDLLEVTLVASRAEQVSNRVCAVTRAGLTVGVMDVESLAIERAAQLLIQEMALSAKDSFICLITLGFQCVQIQVFHGMHQVFRREELLHAPLPKFTLGSMRFSIPEGMNQLGNNSLILESFKEQVIAQIKRCLHFFYMNRRIDSVDSIILAGELARAPGLSAYVEDQLKLKTMIANPFYNVTLGAEVDADTLHKDAPALLTACGLALRRIN